MEQFLTYRYRLYPTQIQEQKILQIAEAARKYYNEILREKTSLYRQTGVWKKKLHVLDEIEQYADKWDVSTDILHYAAGDFNKALQHFQWIYRTSSDRYKESSKAKADGRGSEALAETDLKGFPEEKPFNGPRKTFSFSPSLAYWQPGSVMLPDIGWTKVKIHRLPPEHAVMQKCTVVSKSSGRFYIHLEFRVEIEETTKEQLPEEALGLVFLPGFLAIRSDGEPVPVRHTDPVLEDQIRRSYKTLSRRIPGSKRYEKQRQKLARLYEKQTARRWDTLHKASRQIVDEGKYVGIQMPAVKKQAAQLKRDGLDEVVRDEAWYRFYSMLLYKTNLSGLPARVVPRAYPIWRICAACGYMRNKVPRTSAWICPRCGVLCGKAGNASRNIKRILEKEMKQYKENNADSSSNVNAKE